MKHLWHRVGLIALGFAILGTAFLAGRAWAGGVPSTAALTYSGTLENADGTPLTGNHNVQVAFWNAATGGTTPACQTTPTSLSGRFSVSLPDTCAAAMKASPNVWAEVLVDGASLGRAKIGAVPYALEASHATAADSAANATIAASAAVSGGAAMNLHRMTITADNNGAAHSPSAVGRLSAGEGQIPRDATIIGVKYESGLYDGCEIITTIDTVNASGTQRVIVEVSGFSGPSCANVGVLTFSCVYATP